MPNYAKYAHSDQGHIGYLMSEPSDEILTIEEVAAYLKAGRRTVYRLAANGQIPAFKLGGTWRFQRAELDRWIAARIPQMAGVPVGAPDTPPPVLFMSGKPSMACRRMS